MHFGENQLSRSLIGLSPLTTGHPPPFQRWWVRSSTQSYPRFNLPMARSPRFGSRTCDYNALFRLAFATATPHGLTSPHATDSQAHSSKGTPSPTHPERCQALTDCRRTVSGTLSLPSRGTFHHSLTVLSAIGHQEVFSLTRWSWQIHGRFQESTATRGPSPETGCFHLRDSHPLRPAIPHHSANTQLYHSAEDCQTPLGNPTTPYTQPLTSIPRTRFRLHPLSLATTHGITYCFLFLRVLRCFTSPRSPPHPMNSECR
jgi:hypothetical protein